MKRSVAIVGPTPALLRWAIGKPCPFRDLEHPKLPDATFKQLRVLRAASVALIEDRIQDGVVLHPQAAEVPLDMDKDTNKVMGFPFDEAVDVHGGQAVVESQCGGCPANVSLVQLGNSNEKVESARPATSGNWAGCFGWLPFSQSSPSNRSPVTADQTPDLETSSSTSSAQFAFVDLMRPLPKDTAKEKDWVDELELAIDRAGLRKEFVAQFGRTNSMWYAIWSRQVLDPRALGIVDQAFQSIDVPEGCIDFWRLRNAVQVCAKQSLSLHVDLMPSGISDGMNWTIEPQCQTCGVTRQQNEPADAVCFVCHSNVQPFRQRKTKVLGLRPYLDLARVIGKEATDRILKRWIERRQPMD
jgi:hypothetical protein